MDHKVPFALFSGSLADKSAAENLGRTEFLGRELTAAGIEWTPVLGAYKGVKEQSFLALLPQGDDSHDFDAVLRLAKTYGQESILYVDAQRLASLHYMADDADVEFVGQFGEAAEADALAQDGYTFFAGHYYTVA